MKKYIFKSFLCFAVLAGITFGCSEDFLEVPPIGRVSSENFLKTDNEVFMGVIGLYDLIQRNNADGSWTSAYFIKNLPADDCNAGGGGESDQQEYQYIDDFNILSDNSKIENIWWWYYKTVSSANTIITVVDADTPAKKQLVAEAKAIRGYIYFELVSLFGEVPLMTVNPTSQDQYHLRRTGLDTIYAQIEADLGAGIADLPLKSEYSGADKFRFSKGTAQAMLGKVLLFQEKYGEAATQFAAVIASEEYDLEADYSTLWDEATEFGVESVFETSYTSRESYDWGSFSWSNDESNIEIQLQGTRDFFDLTGTDMVNGWGFNYPTAKLWKAFEDEGDELRRKATMMSEQELIDAGGEKKESNVWDYEGYLRVKYACRESQTDPSAVRELNYTTNWRLMRYADVLLMAAEAYNRNSEDGKAIIEINKVRTRAGMAPLSSSGDQLFSDIKKERQLELAMEGVRFLDLIRWGDASTELGSLGFVSGKHELFPIPLNEIIGNNAMTTANQNPNY